MIGFEELLIALFYAVASATGLCLAANRIAPVLRLMDYPTSRKSHAAPTPMMGGIVVLVSIVPSFVILAWLGGFLAHSEILIATLAILGLAMLGIFDDLIDQTPIIRLVVASVIFACVASFADVLRVDIIELHQPRITFVLDRAWVGVAFTTLCCVGLVNAVNMADGKNGLVPGLALGWLTLLFLAAPAPLSSFVLVMMAVVGILLFFNLRGRLFLGDGGAYGLATAIGLLAILVYDSVGPGGERPVSADGLVLLFFVPVIDLFRLTYTRLRAGLTPFTPGPDHFHHYLKEWLGWPAGLFVYWLIAIIPAALKFIFDINSLILAAVGLAGYIIVIFRASNRTRLRSDGVAHAAAPSDEVLPRGATRPSDVL